MKTIWKYPLPSPKDSAPIQVPIGSKPLCVQVQPQPDADFVPMVWIEISDRRLEPLQAITFTTVGTGHNMNDVEGQYLGTFQLPGLVFHVYYKIRPDGDDR